MIVCAVLIFIIIFYADIYNLLTTTQVARGQRQWNLASGYKNSEAAADMLSRTNAKLINFLRILKNKYHIDESFDDIAEEENFGSHLMELDFPNDTYMIVKKILQNYDPDRIFETNPRFSGGATSYTVAKGQTTYFCLRNKDDPDQLVDEDILFFVMLHEISHIGNYNGMHHTTQFWEVFKFILHLAHKHGFYIPVNYNKYPIMYCGLLINYQPLYDDTLTNLWIK